MQPSSSSFRFKSLAPLLVLLVMAQAGCRKDSGPSSAPRSPPTAVAADKSAAPSPAERPEVRCSANTPAAQVLLTASEVTRLPEPRVSATALVQGRDLWLVGGQTTEGARVGKIVHAKVGDDGRPSGWQEVGSLPDARPNAGFTLVDGAIYMLGGETGDPDGEKDGSNEVFVSRPDAKGRFPKFKPAGPALPVSRIRAAVTSGPRTIYVVGGQRSRAALPDALVWIIRLSEKGEIVGYEPGEPLPEPRQSASLAIVGNQLFVVGGYFEKNDAPCAAHTVLRATLDADGRPGPWKASTSVASLPAGASLAVLGHSLHLVGGVTNYGDRLADGPVGSVLCATVGDDGELSKWRRIARMKDRRYGHASAVIDSRLFVFGGLLRDVEVQSDVLLTPLSDPCAP